MYPWLGQPGLCDSFESWLQLTFHAYKHCEKQIRPDVKERISYIWFNGVPMR